MKNIDVHIICCDSNLSLVKKVLRKFRIKFDEEEDIVDEYMGHYISCNHFYFTAGQRRVEEVKKVLVPLGILFKKTDSESIGLPLIQKAEPLPVTIRIPKEVI